MGLWERQTTWNPGNIVHTMEFIKNTKKVTISLDSH